MVDSVKSLCRSKKEIQDFQDHLQEHLQDHQNDLQDHQKDLQDHQSDHISRVDPLFG